MAKQYKLIKDIFPMSKGWIAKVSVAKKTMPQESQHHSNKYQRLILIDSEVKMHYIYIYMLLFYRAHEFWLTSLVLILNSLKILWSYLKAIRFRMPMWNQLSQNTGLWKMICNGLLMVEHWLEKLKMTKYWSQLPLVLYHLLTWRTIRIA